MKLIIDNLDGNGPRDYTAALDTEHEPRLRRRLNQPSELAAWLVSDSPSLVVPAAGGHVVLSRENGTAWFTGFLTATPQYEYLGWSEHGPAYRYMLVARGEESLLDRKRGARRSSLVNRSAGSSLRKLTEDLLPGSFDLSGVDDVATLPWYSPSPQLPWSEHARRLAVQARAAYRVHAGAISFHALGAVQHALDEDDPNFVPGGLKLDSPLRRANRVTVEGNYEPRAHVRDYFLADGFTLRFNLSETPFARGVTTLVDEEFHSLRSSYWSVHDPTSAVAAGGGKLHLDGGDGVERGTRVCFAEQIELGGALALQHGDFTFTAASDAIVGGLYNGDCDTGACLAGFRVTPSGAQCLIRPWIGDAAAGAGITTVAGRRYVLATRVYATEIYRRRARFYSSVHAGGLGGSPVDASARVVLEVHEIDPNDPPSVVAASTVLYDGVLAAVPDYVAYALVSAAQIHADIAFTRLLRAPDAEVRSSAPGNNARTRLVGALSEGGECSVGAGELRFFSAAVPAANEQIVVRYRSGAPAFAQAAAPPAEPAALPGDDRMRDLVVRVSAPAPRTSEECADAAQAVLDDAAQIAWSGEYQTASDFLAAEIFPGDALAVRAPSRQAEFTAIVREVEVLLVDPAGDRADYTIRFANEAAAPLAVECEAVRAAVPESFSASTLGDLTAAEVIEITSTSVTIDAGTAPPASGGIEVRRSDAAWGADNDRNLIGRYTTPRISLPRLARVQDFFLRQYDSAANYSRHATLLHVDYPF